MAPDLHADKTAPSQKRSPLTIPISIAESVNLDKHLLDCDLLIIDDLGTEMVNTFTNTALFECINERYLRRKSTIISTNYSISDLKNNYSERTFSRITSNYTLLKIYGEDLRIYNKLTPNKP